MYIINLEKLDGDGKKIPLNNPNLVSPDCYAYVQLRYNDFSSSYAVQGDYVSGYPSTFEFDLTDALQNYNTFKCYISADGVTYTENVTFGGTEGKYISREEEIPLSNKFSFYFQNGVVLYNDSVINSGDYTLTGTKTADIENYVLTFNADFFALTPGGAVDINKYVIRYSRIVFDTNDVAIVGYMKVIPYDAGTSTEKKRKFVVTFLAADGDTLYDFITQLQPVLIELESFP